MKLLHKKHHVVCWKRGERDLYVRGETAPVHNVQNLPLKTVACRGRPSMRTHQTLYAHFALHSQTLKQRISDRVRGVRDLREGRLFKPCHTLHRHFFFLNLKNDLIHSHNVSRKNIYHCISTSFLLSPF